MQEKSSRWQTEDLTRTYLEGVRGAIPMAAEQIGLILNIVTLWCPNLTRFIDLGCGDGILGRTILERFPEAEGLFMDFSDPMLEAARGKVKAGRNVTVIKEDFGSPRWLDGLETGKGFDLVVSGFSIHHQPHERKRELYAEILQLLVPGGVFLNLEHVASPTPSVQTLFDEYFVDHLFEHHRSLTPGIARESVARQYYERPDKGENILAPVERQCEWLSEIGFADVDCFFKVFELALFGGRKSIHP